MLNQFLSSIISYFISIEPMNAYVQSIPEGVEYPCYLINRCEINTESFNSVYFINTIHPYIRIFGQDEIEIKEKAFNLVNTIFKEHRKIPILDIDGKPTRRFIRIENIESIPITVDENEVYCVEINFSFDTTHVVNITEFDMLKNVYLNK